jgi:hypothetical protein
MRNYKQGEPRARRLERTASDIEINDEATPQYVNVRTVPNEGVCDAYYPYGNQAHGHHLQSGGPDMDMAVWSFNEQARLIDQEDRNKDETIKPNKR